MVARAENNRLGRLASVMTVWLTTHMNTDTKGATMDVTILCPTGEVHRTGCRDIARKLSDHRNQAQHSYSIEAASTTDVAVDFWADFIDEGSMTEDDAVADTTFASCIVIDGHTGSIRPSK